MTLNFFPILCENKALFVFLTRIDPIAATKNHIPEDELVKRLVAKDKSALDYLYTHYSGAIYGVIVRIVPNEGIAEEVLQDVFLKFWNEYL